MVLKRIKSLILALFYPEIIKRLKYIDSVVSAKDYYKKCYFELKKSHKNIKPVFAFSDSVSGINLNNEKK